MRVQKASYFSVASLFFWMVLWDFRNSDAEVVKNKFRFLQECDRSEIKELVRGDEDGDV